MRFEYLNKFYWNVLSFHLAIWETNEKLSLDAKTDFQLVNSILIQNWSNNKLFLKLKSNLTAHTI